MRDPKTVRIIIIKTTLRMDNYYYSNYSKWRFRFLSLPQSLEVDTQNIRTVQTHHTSHARQLIGRVKNEVAYEQAKT